VNGKTKVRPKYYQQNSYLWNLSYYIAW
jgi:hypothetical protein